MVENGQINRRAISCRPGVGVLGMRSGEGYRRGERWEWDNAVPKTDAGDGLSR